MRLTIIAGLIVGMALAIQSMVSARARASAAHAADARPAYMSAADVHRDRFLTRSLEPNSGGRHNQMTA